MGTWVFPPRGETGVRPVPGRGGGAAKAAGLRLRRGAGPFPVRRGCRGSPAASKPPFSFRLRRKEKALFDGVKRKDAGGGIPGFARNARSACYGGFGLVAVDGVDHSTEYGSCKSWGRPRMPCSSLFAAALWWLGEIGGRSASGCSAVLFCCRTLVVGWRLVEGALPDTLCFSFAAAVRWLREAGAGALPDTLFFSFAAAVRWLRKIGNVGGTPLRMPGCGSEKRTAAHPGGTRSSDDVKS